MYQNSDFIFWSEHSKKMNHYIKPIKTLKEEDSFWYLATPYAKLDMEQAYQDACRMYALLLENDIFAYCPIAQNHGSAKYINEADRMTHKFWLHHDFKFLSVAKGLIVCKMKGWDESVGVAEEIKFAEKYNKPVIYTEFMEVPRLDVGE